MVDNDELNIKLYRRRIVNNFINRNLVCFRKLLDLYNNNANELIEEIETLLNGLVLNGVEFYTVPVIQTLLTNERYLIKCPVQPLYSLRLTASPTIYLNAIQV